MSEFPSEEELKIIREELSKGIASRPLPKDATPVDKIKFQLCRLFIIYRRENDITQRELAKRLEIDEALMSKILHYHYDEFSVDRLIRFISKLCPDMEIKLEVA